MYFRSIFLAASVAFLPVSVFGQVNHTQRGAITGGAAGAVIGGIIGNQNDETPEGVLIGGAVGAIAGGLFGKQQDHEQFRNYQHQQQVAQHKAALYSRGVSLNDVVALTQTGVSTEVILKQIEINGVKRRVGVNEIIALHQQGVNSIVIEAMQHARLATAAHPAGPVLRSRPVPVQTVVSPHVIIAPAPIPLYRPSYGHYRVPGHGPKRHGQSHSRGRYR